MSMSDPIADMFTRIRNAQATGKREKLSLANSLGVRRAESAIPAMSALVADTDPEIARAGIAALAKIGGPGSAEALKKAGAQRVWLAGKHESAGIDANIFAGADVVHLLKLAQAELGVAQ